MPNCTLSNVVPETKLSIQISQGQSPFISSNHVNVEPETQITLHESQGQSPILKSDPMSGTNNNKNLNCMSESKIQDESSTLLRVNYIT